jgi:hypothetical protein
MPPTDVQNVEVFARSVAGFSALSTREQVEVLVYYWTAIVGNSAATGSDVENLRLLLKMPRGGAAATLSSNSRGKARRFVKLPRGYSLARNAEPEVLKRLGRPTAQETSRALREHVGQISSGPLRDYLTEATGAFESGFLRASIVMSWCAAFYVFRDWLFNTHVQALNQHMSTWKKPKTISTVEDFDDLNERTVLDLAKDSSVLPKGHHKSLVALLDQRNAYAHPSGRSVSEAVAEAFIQQVITEVLSRFK